jgi:Protein of unknown function (DUF3592)
MHSVSSRARTSAGTRIGGVLSYGFFFALGLGICIVGFGEPLLQMQSARHWRGTSCEIISSNVTASDSDGSPRYRVDVTYRYFVDDRGYVGDRYQFIKMSSSGYRGKAAIVARLRPRTRTDCWVNPANPRDAVIERGPTADLWYALLPLIFVVVGGAGIGVAALGRGRFSGPMPAAPATPTTRGPTYSKAVHGDGPAALRPGLNRGTQLAIVVGIALLWNGFIYMGLRDLFLSFSRQETISWFALFLVPFILAGIGLLGAAIYKTLQLFNPRPNLTVSNSTVALGEELLVNWSMEGRIGKLTRFSITVEGSETATYTRGTRTASSTSVFATIPLANQIPPGITATGGAKARIPADTMHSFNASHNKVFWVVRVRGEMPNWPDIHDDFPLTVAPRRP